MLKKIFLIFVALLVVGCASTGGAGNRVAYAKKFASDGDFQGAFSILRSVILSNDQSDIEARAEAINFAKANSRIIDAGIASTSADYIRDYSKSNSRRLALEQVEESVKALRFVVSEDDFRKIEAAVKKEAVDFIEADRNKADLLRKKTEDDALRLKALYSDLIDAQSKAQYKCRDKLECDKVFSLTQIFVSTESDMKIQLATDSVIETFNSGEFGKLSMKALKIPGVQTSGTVTLTISCKGMDDVCILDQIAKYRKYPAFIEKMLK
jgi:hypothetical protein